MNLPALCIRRPVMTTLLTAALCVFGVMAYRLLPVSDLPNIDFPTIVVSASLPGATPETMASAVATPFPAWSAPFATWCPFPSTAAWPLPLPLWAFRGMTNCRSAGVSTPWSLTTTREPKRWQ